MVSELAQIDALPSAQVQTAVGDGDGKADTEEGAFGMGGHIVQAFHGVVIVRFVLLHQVIHNLT